MSSTFVQKEISSKTGKGGFGTSQTTEVYLQFVPGQVTDVATSFLSKTFIGENDQNAILAKSHIKDTETESRVFVQDKKYIPLFRGQVDTPSIGDPVLLCNIGGIDYYLGPLNTTNSPNHNLDYFGKLGNVPGESPSTVKLNSREQYGESLNFVKGDYPRLQKPYKEELDNPNNNKKAIRDIHGDMMFEGRHGNSIRIGSRHKDPYIFISNGRNPGNFVESLNDGSIFTMIEKGALNKHFSDDAVVDESSGEPAIVDKNFILPSDSKEGVKRFIGDEKYNYNYENSQMFLSSHKITLNSISDSIFLSSINNVVIGASENIEFISDKSTIIESSNIYLGKQAKQKIDEGEKAEPIVLGNKLNEFLLELLEVLQEANGLCQGAPIPLIDPSNKPLSTKFSGLIRKLKNPEFFSEYHFIEDNGQKPE